MKKPIKISIKENGFSPDYYKPDFDEPDNHNSTLEQEQEIIENLYDLLKQNYEKTGNIVSVDDEQAIETYFYMLLNDPYVEVKDKEYIQDNFPGGVFSQKLYDMFDSAERLLKSEFNNLSEHIFSNDIGSIADKKMNYDHAENMFNDEIENSIISILTAHLKHHSAFGTLPEEWDSYELIDDVYTELSDEEIQYIEDNSEKVDKMVNNAILRVRNGLTKNIFEIVIKEDEGDSDSGDSEGGGGDSLTESLVESINTLLETSPPGWSKTVEKMKEEGSIDNPFALAWYLYNKGNAGQKPLIKKTIKIKRKDNKDRD